MQIERFQYRRQRNWLPAASCGCIAFIGLAAIALVFGLALIGPGLVLNTLGFRGIGETEDIFVAAVPIPTPVLLDASAPGNIVVQAGAYGQRSFNSSGSGYQAEIGSDGSSPRLMRASFTEAGLQALCQQFSDVCGAGSGNIRNARINLRSGGAVIRAEVRLPEVNIWQELGVVLRVDALSRLRVEGVDINGTLYEVPPGELASIVQDAERIANDALAQLVAQAGADSFRLSEILVDETTLTIILR